MKDKSQSTFNSISVLCCNWWWTLPHRQKKLFQKPKAKAGQNTENKLWNIKHIVHELSWGKSVSVEVLQSCDRTLTMCQPINPCTLHTQICIHAFWHKNSYFKAYLQTHIHKQAHGVGQPCFYVSNMHFPSAILTAGTHDPPVFAGIPLEVKEAEILHSSTQPQSLFNLDKSALIGAQRRENKLPPIDDEWKKKGQDELCFKLCNCIAINHF